MALDLAPPDSSTTLIADEPNSAPFNNKAVETALGFSKTTLTVFDVESESTGVIDLILPQKEKNSSILDSVMSLGMLDAVIDDIMCFLDIDLVRADSAKVSAPSFLKPFLTAKTASTMTASTPANICKFAFSGTLFCTPYVTQTNPDDLTTPVNLGHSINGVEAATMPNKFHFLANAIAACNDAARMSAISRVPASVKYKMGIEGCFNDNNTQISGWNSEKMMSAPLAFSYTTFNTVSTQKFMSTATWAMSSDCASSNIGYLHSMLNPMFCGIFLNNSSNVTKDDAMECPAELPLNPFSFHVLVNLIASLAISSSSLSNKWCDNDFDLAYLVCKISSSCSFFREPTSSMSSLSLFNSKNCSSVISCIGMSIPDSATMKSWYTTGTWSLVNCTSNSTYDAPNEAAAMNDSTVFSPNCKDFASLLFLPNPAWPMTLVETSDFQ